MKKSVPLSSRTKKRKIKEELDYFNPLSNTYNHDTIPEKLLLESNIPNEIPITNSNSQKCRDNFSFTTADNRLPEELNKSKMLISLTTKLILLLQTHLTLMILITYLVYHLR